jgi:hypothetical protein
MQLSRSPESQHQLGNHKNQQSSIIQKPKWKYELWDNIYWRKNIYECQKHNQPFDSGFV